MKAHLVGFDSVKFWVLERVAKTLGGVYHNVLKGTEMKTALYSIYASLSTRAGLALT